MSAVKVDVRRIYDPAGNGAVRVLVDRLWPRGLAKADARFDDWCKVVAPSTELRRWYAHRPERFDEFKRRYLVELAEPEQAAAVEGLRRTASQGRLVLLTATKDVDISAAKVLAEHLGR